MLIADLVVDNRFGMGRNIFGLMSSASPFFNQTDKKDLSYAVTDIFGRNRCGSARCCANQVFQISFDKARPLYNVVVDGSRGDGQLFGYLIVADTINLAEGKNQFALRRQSVYGTKQQVVVFMALQGDFRITMELLRVRGYFLTYFLAQCLPGQKIERVMLADGKQVLFQMPYTTHGAAVLPNRQEDILGNVFCDWPGPGNSLGIGKHGRLILPVNVRKGEGIAL